MLKLRIVLASILLEILSSAPSIAAPITPVAPAQVTPSGVAARKPPAVLSSALKPAPSRDRASSRHAVGGEFFYSSDSDGTEVARAAADYDVRAASADRYLGVRVERAWYNPNARGWEKRDRIYLRAADRFGDWQLRARVGTDGHTVVGSVSLNDGARLRKEFFAERDIVETPQGLDRGIYSTFAGATVDVPIDERNVFTALAGLQAFTGDNVRLHLRGSFVHVLRPQWGLSAQLRGRYFHSSDPAEFDYYSPRWYGEVLPVVQMRRFVSGWELVGAAGLGLQRDSSSNWRSSRYAHANFRNQVSSSDWWLTGDFTYTNTPSVSGTSNSGYSYVQFNAGMSRRF